MEPSRMKLEICKYLPSVMAATSYITSVIDGSSSQRELSVCVYSAFLVFYEYRPSVPV